MGKTDVKMIPVMIAISLSLSFLMGCSSEPESVPASVSAPRLEIADIAVGPQVGRLAPVFSVVNTTGERTSLSDMRGKAVMLNFWATWCSPCKAEMPLIEELSRENRQDMVLLTINSGESDADVTAFMNKQRYSFPVLLDMQGKISQAYQVRGIPTTFFIDKKGIIQNIKIGAFSSDTELDQILKRIAGN